MCIGRTLLVVPLALHLLDDAKVEHGVPALVAAAQGRQEVPHDALVAHEAWAGQAGEVLQDHYHYHYHHRHYHNLQDKLLPVLCETLENKINSLAGDAIIINYFKNCINCINFARQVDMNLER